MYESTSEQPAKPVETEGWDEKGPGIPWKFSFLGSIGFSILMAVIVPMLVGSTNIFMLFVILFITLLGTYIISSLSASIGKALLSALASYIISFLLVVGINMAVFTSNPIPIIYAPLFTRLNVIFAEFANEIQSFAQSTGMGDMLQWISYAWILEFILMFIVIFITIIFFSWMVKAYMNKNTGTAIILTVITLIVFLVVSVALPWGLYVFSAGSDTLISAGAGGYYLSNGVAVLMDMLGGGTGATSEWQLAVYEMAAILPNYSEQKMEWFIGNLTLAQKWFNQTLSDITSLDQMGVFLLFGFEPRYGKILSQIKPLANGLIRFAIAIKPFGIGLVNALLGFDKIFVALNLTTTSASTDNVRKTRDNLAITAINETMFDEGIAYLNNATESFSAAFDQIKKALSDLGDLDENTLNEIDPSIAQQYAAFKQNISDVNTLLTAFNYLFKKSNTTNLAPIIHFMYGIKDMILVQDAIGTGFDFSGTTGYFQRIAGNMSIVTDALSGITLTEGGEIADIGNALVYFTNDTASMMTNLSTMGIGINNYMTALNLTLSEYQSAADVTEVDYSYTSTTLSWAEGNATLIRESIDNMIALQAEMENSANAGSYGNLRSATADILNVFTDFKLASIANDIENATIGFNELNNAMKKVQDAEANLGDPVAFNNDKTAAQNHLSNSESAFNNVTTIDALKTMGSIVGEINSIVGTMDTTNFYTKVSEIQVKINEMNINS